MARTIVHFGSPAGTSYGETKRIIIVKKEGSVNDKA
jgi:hypothetical protein